MKLYLLTNLSEVQIGQTLIFTQGVLTKVRDANKIIVQELIEPCQEYPEGMIKCGKEVSESEKKEVGKLQGWQQYVPACFNCKWMTQAEFSEEIFKRGGEI